MDSLSPFSFYWMLPDRTSFLHSKQRDEAVIHSAVAIRAKRPIVNAIWFIYLIWGMCYFLQAWLLLVFGCKYCKCLSCANDNTRSTSMQPVYLQSQWLEWLLYSSFGISVFECREWTRRRTLRACPLDYQGLVHVLDISPSNSTKTVIYLALIPKSTLWDAFVRSVMIVVMHPSH